MIDFRFFIISIVAVFLALGIGIVLGSGLFGDPIIQRIERQVDDALGRNAELQQEVLDLEARLDEDRDFMSAVEAVAVEGKLPAAEVVLIEIEGSEGDLTDGIRSVVDEAGGEVVSEVRITDRAALEDPAQREELAQVLGTTTTEVADLRLLLGDEVGDALTALAQSGPQGIARGAEQTMEELVDLGFVDVDAPQGTVVPEGAAFVVATGSGDQPPWPVEEFVESLGSALAQARARGVVAETSDSAWEVVSGLRGSDLADAPLSTVDNAETSPGRIAIALALSLAPESTGHWGTGDGAAGPVPTPTE